MDVINLKDKILISLLVSGLVIPCYFLLQHFQLFKPIEIPQLFIDTNIAFWEGSFWIYQSLYPMLFLIGLAIKSRPAYLQYSGGVLATCLTCNLFFLLLPTICPRIYYPGSSNFYLYFTRIELPFNAFPSMHVALAVFAILFCIKRPLAVSLPIVLIVVWAACICLSTLFLKQHFIIDVIGGACVGLGASFFNLNPLKLVFK